MKILKDYFNRIDWWVLVYFIAIINIIYLITGDWSVIVLLTSTIIGVVASILSYIQHIAENHSNKPKLKNVGVICASARDFIEWRNKHKLDSFENKDYLPTTKKFKVDDCVFWRISNPNDCCSLTLDDVVETDSAHTNPDYEKIKYMLRFTIISNKNIYLKS